MDKKVIDDEIPSVKFEVKKEDEDQFNKYIELLEGKDIPDGKKIGYIKVGRKVTTVGPFTGAKYYFNFLGVQKRFSGEMPRALKNVTEFFVGGNPVQE